MKATFDSPGGAGAPRALGGMYPKPRVAWSIVAVLFVLYLLSLLDRLVISLLVAPIRRDLGITDFELSLLQGMAFGTFYALCGLPLGWLVDRVSRRWIVFVGVTVWSIATVACGFARNYLHLFLARVGVGAGEASLSPAAYSILADSFPPQRLTFALTVFSAGSLVGTSLAFILGGYIVGLVAAHDSVLLPLVGEVRSWQVVFITVGLPGVLAGLLLFTFAEPRRLAGKPGDADAAGTPTFGAFLRSRRRFLLCHHGGFTLANIAMTGMVVWAPAYLSRSFGWPPGRIGLALGLTGLAGGLIGPLLQGRLADRWFAAGRTDAQMRLYAMCAALAALVGVAGMWMATPEAFLATYFLVHVLVSSVMGMAASSLQIVTPAPLRGRVSALYLFTMIMFGIGAGPSVVAALTDFVFRDDRMLGWSLACTFAVALPLSALVLWLGLRASRGAVAANRAAP
jgi:MFS family permease